MDGVLVDVTESYRATIQQRSSTSPAAQSRAKKSRTGKITAAGMTTGNSPTRMINERGAKSPYEEVSRLLPEALPRRRHQRPDPARTAGWLDPACSTASTAQINFAVFTGRLRWEANVTLNRFPRHVSTP